MTATIVADAVLFNLFNKLMIIDWQNCFCCCTTCIN